MAILLTIFRTHIISGFRRQEPKHRPQYGRENTGKIIIFNLIKVKNLVSNVVRETKFADLITAIELSKCLFVCLKQVAYTTQTKYC